MSNLLSVEAMAKRLGVSRSTLYGLAKRRKVPHLRVGDRVLFNPERVEAALEVPAEGARPLVVATKGRRYDADSK